MAHQHAVPLTTNLYWLNKKREVEAIPIQVMAHPPRLNQAQKKLMGATNQLVVVDGAEALGGARAFWVDSKTLPTEAILRRIVLHTTKGQLFGSSARRNSAENDFYRSSYVARALFCLGLLTKTEMGDSNREAQQRYLQELHAEEAAEQLGAFKASLSKLPEKKGRAMIKTLLDEVYPKPSQGTKKVSTQQNPPVAVADQKS